MIQTERTRGAIPLGARSSPSNTNFSPCHLAQRVGELLPCGGREAHRGEELRLAAVIGMSGIEQVLANLLLFYNREMSVGE
jgi:hypothetical protein